MSSTPPHASAAGTRGAGVSTDWVCPFCALLCDDVAIHTSPDGALDAPHTRCPRLAYALAGYSGTDAQCSASIDGVNAPVDVALERAAAALARARRPLFGGLATDVAGTRALYALAAACGATLDHLHGDTFVPAILAQQDRGSFFTTLSEVRSRADLVVVFACRPGERYPRFYERALGDGIARRIVFVGCDADPAANDHASHVKNVTVETLLPRAEAHDTLARWSALVESRSGAAQRTGDDTATLAALVEQIAAARYTTFVYEPAALPGEHRALLIEALSRIVKAVNRTTRAGAFALGGNDGAVTVNQTLTWLSGMPLRTRVAKPTRLAGEPPLDHDPYRYRTSQLLARGETDLLLWIASFGAEPPPAALDPAIPVIVLGHPALAGTIAARAAQQVPLRPEAIPPGGTRAGKQIPSGSGPVPLEGAGVAQQAPLRHEAGSPKEAGAAQQAPLRRETSSAKKASAAQQAPLHSETSPFGKSDATQQIPTASGATTVFVPVATPGIDAGGHLFRVDNTVALPLTAARAAQHVRLHPEANPLEGKDSTQAAPPGSGVALPSVADVLARLGDRVATLAAHANGSPSSVVSDIAAVPLAASSVAPAPGAPA